MSNTNESDVLKIFAFIDSNTISDGDWLRMNLRKHCLELGIPAIQFGYRTHNTLKEQFVLALLNSDHVMSNEVIKTLATKIKTAWRVRKHRKSKQLVNVSIGLEPEVAAKLSKMCIGHKKNEIVTKLIQNNYEAVLKDKKELALKRLEAKKIRDQHKFKIAYQENEILFQKLVVTPTDEINMANSKARIDERRVLAKKMIELLETANTQGVPNREEILQLAKELYEKAA
jgi:ribosome-associated toxin RatA of RatAB toxin-antitoxin module